MKKMMKYIIFACYTSLVLTMGCGNEDISHMDSEMKEKEILLDISETEQIISATETGISAMEIEQNKEIDTSYLETEEAQKEVEDLLKETEDLNYSLQKDWVADLRVSEKANQIIVVSVSTSQNTLSFHEKTIQGEWSEVFSCDAGIGKNGLGKTKEGDKKTPIGVYHIWKAFGIKENPGTLMDYLQVDDSYYWIDDSTSAYYNQLVTKNEVVVEEHSGEHITKVGAPYHYVIALDYNKECVPYVGSAIFIHCTPTKGYGCIAIEEDYMKMLMQRCQEDCIIVIDYENCISKY